MTARLRRFLTILAAVAVPLGLVMAPSVATAKKKSKRVHVFLEGPISYHKDPGYTPLTHLCCFPSYTPTIQIEMKLGGTKAEQLKVTQYGLWGPCSGYEWSDGLSKHEFSAKPRKNGRFSGTDTQYGSDTLTVAGKIVGRSSASGTVREVEIREYKPDGYAWGTCDSGTVTWTASRVPALSDVKGSSDPNLVYPAGL